MNSELRVLSGVYGTMLFDLGALKVAPRAPVSGREWNGTWNLDPDTLEERQRAENGEGPKIRFQLGFVFGFPCVG